MSETTFLFCLLTNLLVLIMRKKCTNLNGHRWNKGNQKNIKKINTKDSLKLDDEKRRKTNNTQRWRFHIIIAIKDSSQLLFVCLFEKRREVWG